MARWSSGRSAKADTDVTLAAASTSASRRTRPWCSRQLCYWLVGLVCVVMVLLVVSLLTTMLLLQRSEARARVYNVQQSNDLASRWASRARALHDESRYVARSMQGYVRGAFITLPDINASAEDRTANQSFADFTRVAQLYTASVASLKHIFLAPGGAVSQIYPPNPLLINWDLFSNKSSSHGIEAPYTTMLRGQLFIEGPLYKTYDDKLAPRWLINIRVPVYNISDPSKHSINNFWGMVYVAIDVLLLLDDEAFVADDDTSYLWFSMDPDDTINAIKTTLHANATQTELRAFIDNSATRTLVDSVPKWLVAVQRHERHSLLTRENVIITVVVIVGSLLLLFVVAALIIERCTRVYDGRMYAPKLTPFAVLTIGPCYGEELWNLVPVQMAEVIDKLNHVLNKQMAVHHAYKVAQMQPYTTVFVLRTVEAAVRMSFDVIAELQRHPIDADLTTLLDADGQLLMAYAVHLCTDVAIVPSVTGDRSYRYEGADMVYGARMWAFSAPNTVTLSAAAQPHACAMRDGAGSKGGSDKCNKGSGDSSSNGSRSSRSTSSGNSGIHVSSYTTIFLRGVKGKQELYTVTDSTNKYLVHAIAQAQARVQRELCAQEQLAQQQHRVRARARLHSGDASYSSANASSMYVSSSTTLFGASLPGSHNMPASDASSGSRYDLGASVAEQDGRSASQSDVAHELPQQTSTTTMTAVAAATSLRRGASVTVPPCERLAVSPAYTHEQSSSGSGKVSNSTTHNVTTATATAAVVATVMPASPACNTTVSSSSSSSNAATAGVAGSGGGGGTVAHARPLVPPQLHLHTEGDNPLAADTTLASAASSHTVGAIRDNSGGGLLGSVATTVMRAATAAVGSTTKRNSGGAGGGTSGPLRIDVPVNPLMAPAASSTTPQRSVTNNMATTIAASAAAAAVAGGDGAHVDGAAVTVSASCGTASSVGGGGSSMGGGSGSSASAGMMHAASLHGSSAQRASLTGEPADNPLELGNAPPLPLHAPKMSDLSGVVMLSEKSDEHTPQHSSCPSQQHPHAAQLQQQLPLSHDEQQVHLLQHQPVSLNTISSNTLLNGFGPLQCTAPPATVAAAAATTATASMRASNTVVSPEYGLRDANTYAWLHRAIPLWLDKALRRAFEHQSIALEVSYESVRVMVYYFYASYKLLFRPLAVPERDNIYRRLITAFGIPRKDILEHLAARCTIHYMQQHEHTKSLAWKMCAPTQI